MALRRKFSVSKFWDDTRKFNAVAICYIGELCRYLLNQAPDGRDADNPVVKVVGNGMRPDVWKSFKDRFGIDEVYEFYGASEGNIAFINLLKHRLHGWSLPSSIRYREVRRRVGCASSRQ